MWTRPLPPCVAGLLLAAVVAASTESAAQQADPALAETLFNEGIQLYEQGKHAEACPKFAASHKADPGHGAIQNLGTCYAKIGKTASAWAAFREAAAIAKTPGDIADDTRQAQALEPILLRLRIVVEGADKGLSVTRDGVPIDRAAWGTAVPVDPGTYRVEASSPGKNPWLTTVTIAGEGKTTQVDIPVLAEVIRPSSTSAPASTPETPSRPLGAQRAIALVAGGVGLAGLVIGGGMALAAKSKWDDAKPHCDAQHYCDPIGLSEGKAAHSLAQGATWVFVTGALSLAAGVTLWLTASPAPAPARKRASGVLVVPWLGQDAGGLTWTDRF